MTMKGVYVTHHANLVEMVTYSKFLSSVVQTPYIFGHLYVGSLESGSL